MVTLATMAPRCARQALAKTEREDGDRLANLARLMRLCQNPPSALMQDADIPACAKLLWCVLDTSDRPVMQRELATLLGMHINTVQNNLRLLVERGWLVAVSRSAGRLTRWFTLNPTMKVQPTQERWWESESAKELIACGLLRPPGLRKA